MIERKTVRRWIWIWDFEKEEQWLNTMAMEGWALDSVAFCTYRFVRCEPGEYIIRMEMRAPDGAYRSLVEDMGAEYIGRMSQFIYFRRAAALGAFELNSDIASRLAPFRRVDRILRVLGALNIALGTCNVLAGSRIACLNLLLGCLLMYGLGRVHGKVEQLKRDQLLFE